GRSGCDADKSDIDQHYIVVSRLAGNRRALHLIDVCTGFRGQDRGQMGNFLRTSVLLAGLTALFMAVGYFIGGTNGMLIALVVAAGMNLFSYWNSDKLVL